MADPPNPYMPGSPGQMPPPAQAHAPPPVQWDFAGQRLYGAPDALPPPPQPPPPQPPQGDGAGYEAEAFEEDEEGNRQDLDLILQNAKDATHFAWTMGQATGENQRQTELLRQGVRADKVRNNISQGTGHEAELMFTGTPAEGEAAGQAAASFDDIPDREFADGTMGRMFVDQARKAGFTDTQILDYFQGDEPPTPSAQRGRAVTDSGANGP